MTSRCLTGIRCGFLLVAMLLLAGPARAETIEMAYPEEDGIDQGPGHFLFDFLRVAELVTDDSGLQIRWVPLPGQRILHHLDQQSPAFCAAGAGITPEREKLGKFTAPFIEDRLIAVIAPKSHRAELDKAKSLNDLIHSGDTTFLAYLGTNLGPQMTSLLKQLGDRLQHARSTAQMLDMMAGGHADFALEPYKYAANYLATRPDRDQFILRVYPDMHREFFAAFLCSKAVPDEVIARLNEAIARQAPRVEPRFAAQEK